MKNIRVAFAVLITIVITASMSSAQLSNNKLPWKVQVPFSFHVGSKLMPAGQYQVLQIGESVFLRSLDGKDVVSFMPVMEPSSGRSSTNALRFNGYGRTQFLAEVILRGSGQAGQISKSKMEREFAKQISPFAETINGQ